MSIGIALFGVGRMGEIHLKNMLLNPRVNILWIIEEDATRAVHIKTKYRLGEDTKLAKVSNMVMALVDPKVEMVMVCTPAFQHEEIVKKSLDAGKSVFCEKPLAPTSAAARECYDLAKVNQKHLFCGFNRRWDPQLRLLHQQVSTDVIGKPRVIKCCSRDPPGLSSPAYTKASGGTFIDSAIHDFDMLCWLAGECPVTLYCAGHATDPVYVECDDVDTTVILLTFASGLIGTIEVCRNAHFGYDQRIEVLGTKGMLQSENIHPLQLRHWTLEGTKLNPIEQGGIQRYLASYELEFEHFLDVMQGKAEMEVTTYTTCTAQILAEACRESWKDNKVIDLEPRLNWLRYSAH